MSIATWIEEFYPVSAAEIASESWEEVTKHSLKKWEGLRVENLEKHEIIMPPIVIDADTCALCQKTDLSYTNCFGCPLYKYRDGVPCFDILDEENNSPYDEYTDRNDPEPMISNLKGTLRYLGVAVDEETKS